MSLLTYCQSTGDMLLDGAFLGRGGSGTLGDGFNDATKEGICGVGPIPAGMWQVVGPAFDSPTHGPCCLRLVPQPGTNTYGRSEFLIHSPKVPPAPPWDGSNGCILQLHPVRSAIAAMVGPGTAGVMDLKVVAGPQTSTPSPIPVS